MTVLDMRDRAILWVHETVGDNLDGEATLGESLAWIECFGTPQRQTIAATFRILFGSSTADEEP